jgi:hypothetical protein
MLLWLGAIVSAYLGYRLWEWWAPLGVACAVVIVQAVAFRGLLGDAGGVQLLAFSLAINLAMSYAAFTIGRSLAQRMAKRRKGTP